MASLFNTRISDTYSGLIKTIDNAALTSSLKELTDGSGLASGVFMNTAGDFKVTAILEFGSLKDTGENIIISKFVDAADGIGNNDNDTTIPTTAAIIDYVAAQITIEDLDFTGDTGSGQIDLDSQIFAINGTTNEITTVASNQSITFSLDSTGVNLPDNSTAITQTAGDNSTKIATTSYVDTLDAASDLDFSGDSGTGDVNLNTQTFAITGTANQIESSASGQGLSLQFPSAGVTLPNGSVATTQASSDDSTKVATTAYVKGLNNASDLDFTTDSGSGAVVLNSETLSVVGTTNEIETSGSGQEIQIGLPSSISTNLVGNVTGNLTGNVVGDLTGNADTATAWETARDLSLTGQATGTISSVDGTGNVSGAVTLDNNSVTSKVLTGLTSPSASSVLATDTIVEGFGKLQSQVNGLAGGLRFMGSWDADTNSPVLSSGGGEAANGTTTATTANKLVDSSASFTSTVTVGDQVVNQVDGQTALVSNVDSDTTLSLDADIMLTGEAYTIDNSPFITQGHYYVVSVGGTTTLNGISNWTVGDWVIAGANNQWTKLDHSQVDGTGTTGNLTKWSATQVIADSIVSESGSAITVDGSLTTNTNLSSTGNFAVNTDKFTVAAASGNTAFAGDLAINTDKFTVNATTGNTLVAGTLDVTGNSTFAGDVTISDVQPRFRFDETDTTNENFEFRLNGGDLILDKIDDDFSSNRVERMRIDSNGNFGFRVVAENSSGTWRNFQIGGANLVTRANNNNDLLLGTGFYFNTANQELYENTEAVSRMFFNNDVMTFQNAASGTAGTAITWNERMRIDSSGNVGIGISTIARGPLHVHESSTGYSQVHLTNSSSGSTSNDGLTLFTNGNDAGIMQRENSYLLFGTNDTERMRITSGGELQVTGNGVIKNQESGGNYTYLQQTSSDSRLFVQYSQPLLFGTAGTERMRIDSSGNVSIGTVTPLYLVGTSDVAQISVNRVGTTGAITNTSRSAAYINLNGADGGSSIEFNTASGNNTQPTEKMVIDSSGDVLIGNTNRTDTKLKITGANSGTNPAATAHMASNVTLYNAQGSDGSFSGIDFNNSSDLVDSRIVGIHTSHTSRTGALAFLTHNGTSLSERMRITSDGQLGVNTTTFAPTITDQIKLGNMGSGVVGEVFDANVVDGAARMILASGGSTGQVPIISLRHYSAAYGLDIWMYYSTPWNTYFDNRHTDSGFIFRNNCNADGSEDELMRITGNGQVMIRRTADYDASNLYSLQVGDGSADNNTPIVCTVATTATRNQIVFSNNASNNVGQITTGGSATSYNTSSDYRLKEDLQDFSGLDMISKIPVYDFKWKTDESRSYGVMAHELEEVLPQAVNGEKDAKEMQSVDYSKIVPLLVKSIQELKAEVDKLKQECKCKN